MCIFAIRDFKNYDRILIDTSVLMRRKGLTKFVFNVYSALSMYRQKIIVPASVWLELTRHLNSSDQSLASAASYAIQTINTNRAIFQVEDKEIDYSDVNKAFADKEILADLVLNKPKNRQLLITNDGNLAIDSMSLNDQKSCDGYRIDTCRHSKAGNLVEFDFPNPDITIGLFEACQEFDEVNFSSDVSNLNSVESIG